jgi:hypothetical protein
MCRSRQAEGLRLVDPRNRCHRGCRILKTRSLPRGCPESAVASDSFWISPTTNSPHMRADCSWLTPAVAISTSKEISSEGEPPRYKQRGRIWAIFDRSNRFCPPDHVQLGVRLGRAARQLHPNKLIFKALTSSSELGATLSIARRNDRDGLHHEDHASYWRARTMHHSFWNDEALSRQKVDRALFEIDNEASA